MYNTHHLAARLGITPRQARKFFRAIGFHSPGARYELSRQDIDNLVEQYDHMLQGKCQQDRDDSNPGLPVEALYDPTQRKRFEQLRKQRLQRLDELLAEHKLTIGHMTHTLEATGRILSMRGE